MRRIESKLVYDTLDEIVAPERTALIVVDMQNEFCSPDGIPGKNGANVKPVKAIVPTLQRLLQTARSTSVRVLYLRHTHEPDLSNLSPARLSFYAMLYGGSITPYHAIRGTWGHKIVPELTPEEGEIVINKDRSSGFFATNLDLLLRSNGIESVVISGMATHACVESTARDAGFYDYYVVVVKDGVADYSRKLHQASLLTMSNRCNMATSEEIVAVWKRATSRRVRQSRRKRVSAGSRPKGSTGGRRAAATAE